MTDLRPRWRRWLVPRGSSPRLVALSIAWFAVSLAALIAAEVRYGWRAAPLDHAWHAVAYLAFAWWCGISVRLHRRRVGP